MQLATDTVDYASGPLGLVETVAGWLNDRSKRYWSKAEIVHYLNIAQDSLGNQINAAAKEHFLTSATTPTDNATAYYQVPSDMLQFLSMEVVDNTSTDREPQELREILLPYRKFFEALDLANLKTDFNRFILTGSTFKLAPAAKVSTKYIRVYYVKRLGQLVNNADISEIPLDAHGLLAMDGARLALVKHSKINAALEKARNEHWLALWQRLIQPSRFREETVAPFWGSYGPDRIGSGDYAD